MISVVECLGVIVLRVIMLGMVGTILLEGHFGKHNRDSGKHIRGSSKHIVESGERLREYIIVSREVGKHIEVNVKHLRETGIV